MFNRETQRLNRSRFKPFNGFSDITYFNRTFRKAIGKTPSEYRKHFTDSDAMA
ncbi:MAG: AraC family transcriptional regulator [Verrucomicrobiota bacterium]